MDLGVRNGMGPFACFTVVLAYFSECGCCLLSTYCVVSSVQVNAPLKSSSVKFQKARNIGRAVVTSGSIAPSRPLCP